MRYLTSNGIPSCVLDIGVGSGYYGTVAKALNPDCTTYGVDIFAPNLEQKRVKEAYDKVYVSDLTIFDFRVLPHPPWLVIAADVLEHVSKADAVMFMSKVRGLYDWAVVTMPIVDYPQGPMYGNKHETHRHQWKVDEIQSDLGLTLVEDCGICGLFEFRRKNQEVYL